MKNKRINTLLQAGFFVALAPLCGVAKGANNFNVPDDGLTITPGTYDNINYTPGADGARIDATSKGSLTATNVNLNGYNGIQFEDTVLKTITNTNVTGTNNIISGTGTGVTLGTISMQGAGSAVQINGTGYTVSGVTNTTTGTNEVEVITGGNNLGALSNSTAGSTLTITSNTYDTGATAYNSATVSNGSTLKLQTLGNADTITSTGTTTLNKGTLVLQGDDTHGNYTIDTVEITNGTTDTITSTAGTNASSITNLIIRGGASATTLNLDGTGNIPVTDTKIGNSSAINATINSQNSATNSTLGNVDITAGSTVTYNSGTAGNIGKINSSSTTLNGTTALNINTLNSGSTVSPGNLNYGGNNNTTTITGTGTTTIENVTAKDKDGSLTVTNSSSNDVSIGTITFNDAITSTLNLAGTSGYNITGVTSNGNGTINAQRDVDLNNVTIADGKSLTVNATGGDVTTNPISLGGGTTTTTLNLNATSGNSINILNDTTTTPATPAVSMNGNAVVNIGQTDTDIGAVAINGVGVSGLENTITNTYATEGVSIDGVKFNANNSSLSVENKAGNMSITGDISVGASDILNLNANGGNISTSAITFSGNRDNNLSVSAAASALSIDGVTVKTSPGSALVPYPTTTINTITTGTGTVNLGEITFDASKGNVKLAGTKTATISGVTSKNHSTAFVSNSTAGNNLNNIVVQGGTSSDTASSLSINATAATTFTKANVGQNEVAGNTGNARLNLNLYGGDITSTGAVTLTGNNNQLDIAHSETNKVVLNSTVINGTGSVITSLDDDSSLGDVTINNGASTTFNAGISTPVVSNGNISATSLTLNGNDTVNVVAAQDTSSSVSLGDVTALNNKNVLNITAATASGTTGITSLTVGDTNTTPTPSTLDLNLLTGALTELTTTTVNTNSVLHTNLNAGTLTTTTMTLNDKSTLNMLNEKIDNINVTGTTNGLTLNGTSNFYPNIDMSVVDSTTGKTVGAADKISAASVAGDGAIDLKFVNNSSIYGVPTSGYVVQYVNVASSNIKVNNIIPTEGNAIKVLNDNIPPVYVSYDQSILKGHKNNYPINTPRVTTYNVNSDLLLHELTLQGTKSFQVAATGYFAGENVEGALPNLGATPVSVATAEGTKAVGILNIDSATTEGGTTIHGNGAVRPDNYVSIFKLDNVEGADGAKRLLNFDTSTGQFTITEAKGKNGSAIIINTSGITDEAVVTIGGMIDEDGNKTQFKDPKPFNFYKNSATGNGGAIYNNGPKSYINTYTGMTFEENKAGESGGAIYNCGGGIGIGKAERTLTDKEVYFRNNTATTLSATKGGGAIANVNGGRIEFNADAHFSNNTSFNHGGAIYNEASSLKIGFDSESDHYFINNKAGADGGAIYSTNNDLTIIGDATYAGNKAANGGAIAATSGSKVAMTQGAQTFIGNQASNNGGAVYADGANTSVYMGETAQTFSSNIAGGSGGAIYASNGANVYLGCPQTFTANAATADGGAIKADNAEVTLVGDQTFIGNIAGTHGGAISVTNGGVVNMRDTQTFIGNGAQEKGGAIYIAGNDTKKSVVNLTASNPYKSTVFSGNISPAGNNAIYMDGNATLNLSASNGSSITFDDKIASSNTTGNTINQTAGHVYYNNDNSAFSGDFNLQGGTAHFNSWHSVPFQNGNYSLAAGSTLDLVNFQTQVINANSLTLPTNGYANMNIDLNLTTELSDRFNLANSTSGNILVTGINAYGDNEKEQIFFPIAKGANVVSAVSSVDASYYSYDVMGVGSGLLLTQGDVADTALVAPQVGINAALANQLAMYNQVLSRVDEIAETRYFHKKNKTNLYASAKDVIDNKYTPYVAQDDGGLVWAKPSGTFETISPSGQSGYKNRAWNAIIGYETPIAELRNGWQIINTVFGGYQGSFQDFDEVKNYQNGGCGGYMANIYKNDFFAGATVMLGGMGIQTKDDGLYNRNMEYGIFDSGVAARVGYNVGLGNHWVLQPMFTTSYTFISGYDQHNEKGEDVYAKSTNTIQIAPGFKLVGNYGGWQPYALLNYQWPLIAKTLANVNNVDMPDIGLRSYIEYGVGLRKNMGERFEGHVEAVFRNIGRNGLSFQGGLVYKF